ncbi:hypothetical protein ACFLWU_02610 [Chloroflexota bacterium]
MPGKLYGKGKHPPHSKKSKAMQRLGTMASQPQVAAETPSQAAAFSTPPPPRAPAPMARAKVIQHPYIIAELRRIGILAGITLVILIVLAIVLS